jgi:hypothetical protein
MLFFLLVTANVPIQFRSYAQPSIQSNRYLVYAQDYCSNVYLVVGLSSVHMYMYALLAPAKTRQGWGFGVEFETQISMFSTLSVALRSRAMCCHVTGLLSCLNRQ